MCVGRSRPAPPPPPPPPAPVYRATGTTAPPAPEPTARRVVTGSQRIATMTRRRADETGGGRRTNRLGTLRRLGTKSLRIPLLNISDLNYPL